MKTLEQEFTVHPIGQGLFYSGVIKYDNEVKFRMVFDCGCLPKNSGADEAEYYRKQVFEKEKILDLLVISHFDGDHINHIKTLLRDDVKVKKIVMPFALFEERLFLAAKYISEGGDTTDGTVDFIIDPLGTLTNNFDDGGELYLITAEPDSPIPPDKEFQDERIQDSNEERFLFDFSKDAKRNNNLTAEDNRKFGGYFDLKRGYKISDTHKGMLLKSGGIKLMDFLFYKKNIGPADADFFSKVREKFFSRCGVKNEDSPELVQKKVLERIKATSNATEIKSIFNEIAKDTKKKDRTVTKKKLVNPNTTALCMLHRNLKVFFELAGIDTTVDWDDIFWYIEDFSRATIVNKMGPAKKRVVTRMLCPWIHSHFRRIDWKRGHIIYPNTMLTSDTFLKEETDVNEFFKKYENYWEDFWLFQVPHHGSKENADKTLLSRLSHWKYVFINYGTKNTHGHPNSELLDDIVATGHSQKLLPVHEFQGITYGLYFPY